MRLEMIVAGVVRLAGKSKKTGNDYDFSQVHVLDLIQPTGAVKQCEGFEPRVMECDEAVVSQLRGASFPAPYMCHLTIGRDNKVRLVKVEPAQAAGRKTA